ncbi:glycosyltransferase family 2 protein [Arcticibacter eurypsychrophilus]|uniref:glycosyltransferase family 2 protein n=1 Tax=Arcticibacter eurypsychrophilus TaxID=1434752 RepID=UPI00084D20C7|nr:glycosyltransferase family 2 protein [Arcticibacter eurypsychrophilus]
MQIFKTGGTREAHYPADPQKPLISIIIVTLNAEAQLENCISSILNQVYQNMEIIVFDGGSTDSTGSLLEKYSQNITYWQTEPDNGIYDAMNKAVQKAKGDWLYFIGADDQLLEGFSLMIGKLKDSRTIYYGDMSYNGERTDRKKYTAYRLSKETICHQAMIYPAQVFEQYQYDLTYPLAADWALNLNLWADKQFRFQFYSLMMANFSMTGASSIQKDHQFLIDLPVLIKEKLGWAVYLRYLLKQAKKRFRQPLLA